MEGTNFLSQKRMECIVKSSPVVGGWKHKCSLCGREVISSNSEVKMVCLKTNDCVSLGKRTKSIYLDCKNIRKEISTYECSIHGRCIKHLRPGAKWFRRPEAKIYHVCYGCKDFSTSDQESP